MFHAKLCSLLTQKNQKLKKEQKTSGGWDGPSSATARTLFELNVVQHVLSILKLKNFYDVNLNNFEKYWKFGKDMEKFGMF